MATIEKRAFKFVPESLNGVRAGHVAPLALGDSHLLVFVNGRHAPGLSRLGRLPSGADVGSLAQAVAKRPDRFEALLTRDAEALVNGFTALNAAFWADGATIQPERGRYYAIEDMCSHEAETLSGGEVAGEEIIGPRQGADSSILTGAALSPPAYEPVATLPVRVEGGMVRVKDDLDDSDTAGPAP